MCGIAGYLSLSGLHDGVGTLMADALLHRGPDSGGLWECAETGVCFSHRRLSIIDLSEAGHQPMVSASGRYVIAYNGEIYNHETVRESIVESGHSAGFRGHSDTESLLVSIEIFGLEKSLAMASGMFAFALWDRHEKALYLARDRLGEKPLYYGWQGKCFLFGSELKALQAHPVFSAEIDPVSMAAYCRYRYVPEPRSIFRDIAKLTPGCFLKLSLDDIQSRGKSDAIRYYAVPELATYLDKSQSTRFASDGSENESMVLDNIEDTLEQAVQRQLVADVPVGAFLSGGIDSSIIVAMMQKNSTIPVNTFSIGFEEAGFDESVYARQVAQHLKTSHNEIRVSAGDAREVIPSLPKMFDEPFADSSQIPTFLVAKLAREQVTVSVSGDGGDEVFGGYNRYLYAARSWSTIQKVPVPLRRLTASGVSLMQPERLDSQAMRKFIGFLGGQSIPMMGAKLRKASRALGCASLDELYRSICSEWPDPPAILKTGHEPEDWVGQYPFRNKDMSAMRWMMMQDKLSYLPGDILTKVDRAAMAVSLETRVPFLDPAVLSMAAQLPDHFLMRDGVSKWCLHQILHRHVPKSLMERPKAGFALPLGQWLRGPLREWAEDLLSEKRLDADQIFQTQPIRASWKRHLAGKEDLDSRLWTILMFQSWKQANLEQ